MNAYPDSVFDLGADGVALCILGRLFDGDSLLAINFNARGNGTSKKIY